MPNVAKGKGIEMTAKAIEVVVVGSNGLDTIETKFERRVDLLGGSVSYACAASSFFAPTGMVGVVGDDFPAACLAQYEAFGIDLAGLARERGKTFRWAGVYDDDMINRRTLSTELNVFAQFAPRLPETYRKAPFLLLGNIAPELQLHVLSQLDGPRFTVADTMDLWIKTAPAALNEVIRRVDMIMLNDAEARLLTREHHLRRCAAQLLGMGPRYVVIKKGEHGAILVTRDGIFLVPAYVVDCVVDPTGAGDSFAGGFLGHLAALGRVTDTNVRRSLLYGAVVASFGVEGFSLERLAVLDRPTIESRLAELDRMMRVEA